MARVALGWLLVCVTTAEGCAASRPQTGMAPVRAYLRACRSDDPESAYRLMTPEYRSRVTLAAFRKLWNRYRPEIREEAVVASGLLRRREVVPTAEVALGGARNKVGLVWHRSGWRVLAGMGTEVAGAGPRGLVLALVRVLQTRDWDGFLDLLSRARRRQLVQALSERVTGLKLWLTRPTTGSTVDRIRIYYDSTHYLDLIKEDGVWRLYDFN